MQKIAVIGAGNYGEAVTQFLAMWQLCEEIALYDIREGVAAGVALDINQTSPIFKQDTRVIGSHHPDVILGAEIIIICAGMPRKPGMSRSDLLEANISITDSVLDTVMKYGRSDTKLLFVTNPVDIVTYYAWKKLGWRSNRVFGQAGVLDSARMAFFIAEKTGCSIKDITATVLGGHGDTMVPLLNYTHIAGENVKHFLNEKELEEIVERTRNGGAEVLNLRQNSSAYLAPAAAVIKMVDAIVNNRCSVIPTVIGLDGHYGYADIAIGVPAVLGHNGAGRVRALGLSVDESAMFSRSVSLVQRDIELLKEIRPDVFKEE